MLIVVTVSCSRPKVDDRGDWRIWAMRYGMSTFPAASLLHGFVGKQRRGFAWYAWLIAGHGKRILVDTGFADSKTAKAQKFTKFKLVPDLLQTIGVSTNSITDIILTHLHWDHAGNLAPYGGTRVFVQKEEFAAANRAQSQGRLQRISVRKKDLLLLRSLDDDDSLMLLSGEKEIYPGIRVHVGGAHTRGIQWIEVQTAGGNFVLASDNAYLYENIEKQIPIGATADPQAEARVLNVMRKTASDLSFIVPGHDPGVMERFLSVAEDIVEITATK